eukprot:818436-Pelagomonas_calceolata.AAC.1
MSSGSTGSWIIMLCKALQQLDMQPRRGLQRAHSIGELLSLPSINYARNRHISGVHVCPPMSH